MGLVEQAKTDWQQITTDTDTGFGTAIVLTAPNSSQLSIIGLATKHHIGIDTEGNMVHSKNAHISFSEEQLILSAYPARDANGDVNLTGHTATWIDSTGTSITYVIREFFPDETIGVILCILGELQ